MDHSWRLAELALLSEADHSARLRDLARVRVDPAAERANLEGQLAEYEERYGFDSADLGAQIASGKTPETVDVCEWLMLLDQLAHLNRKYGNSGGVNNG